jgi:hypothetical protein
VSKEFATLNLNAVASIMPLVCMFQEAEVTPENAIKFKGLVILFIFKGFNR